MVYEMFSQMNGIYVVKVSMTLCMNTLKNRKNCLKNMIEIGDLKYKNSCFKYITRCLFNE